MLCAACEVKICEGGPYYAQAGHAIHEDEPGRTAEVLLNFLQRFQIGQPKRPIPRRGDVGIVLPVAAGPVCPALPAGSVEDKPR